MVLLQPGLCWCFWSVLPLKAMQMSMVYAAAWNNLDIQRMCCHWRPYWCGWPALPPKAMLISIVWAVSEGCLGPWSCCSRMFVVCTVARNQVEAHDPCSGWLQKARRPLGAQLKKRDMKSPCDNPYPHSNLAPPQKSNSLDRKPAKKTLQKWDGDAGE